MAISDQAAQASRRGAPLSPDEGIQVAGKGDVLLELFKLFPKAPGRAADAVPTSVEEQIGLPPRSEDVRDPYRQRQQELAPQLLSPQGQQRFQEADMQAGDAINPPPTTEALDALDEADPMADTVSDAQRSLRYADEDMSVRAGQTDAGAADEVDAQGAARATDEERVSAFVRSGADGIDFNFENLETGDDVKAMFNEVSEIYADPTEAAKRGIVTRKETLEQATSLLADELGFTKRLLKRRSGEPLNAEQATAARILLTRSGERLTDLARRIRDGEDNAQMLLQFRRQMSIHAGIQMQVKGMQTEIARALGAFNIPVSARSAEAAAIAADEILRQSGGRMEAKKLAKGLLAAQERGGDAAVHKYAFGAWASKANGIFQEMYVNGLLSWSYTHVKNALATPAFMLYQTLEEVIAGAYGGVERGIGRGVGALTGKDMSEGFGRPGLGSTADGVYMGQAVARMYGWSRSLKDAYIVAAETFRTEIPADALSKMEGAQLKAIDAENLKLSGKAGEVIDVIGRAIRIPGRSLMAADDFWRVFSQRGELYAEAYNQAMTAKALGKSDQEAVDNAAMVILDPRTYSGQLDEAARYNTLTSDMGALGEIATFIQRFPVFGRILMPFAKAPTNAILRTMERTGLSTGYFKDPVKRQKAMARATMGLGTMYLFAEYAASGRVTGAMPRDERQRAMLPPGWKPYSLVYRGDDWPTDAEGDPLPLFDPMTGVPNGPLTYVSYAGLEPVGAILGIAATTVERMRRTNDPEARNNIATTAIAAAAQYFTEMPMIQTIGDITKSFERGDMSFIAEGPLKSYMPYSAAIRAGERAVDPTMRRASGEIEYYTLEEVQGMPPGADGNPQYELVGMVKGGIGGSFNDAMAKWGSMLKDRELMGGASDETSAIQYDVLGQPREMNVRFDTNPVLAMYNLVIPFNVKQGEAPSAIMREQIRLKGPLRTAKEKERGFAFSDAFQAEWTRQAKQEIMTQNPSTNEAETFIEALNNLLSSPDYVGDTDREQFNAIRDIEDRFYDAALDVVFAMPQYREVGEAYRDYRYVRDIYKEQGRLMR